jgi:alpha-L-fucosidase 2
MSTEKQSPGFARSKALAAVCALLAVATTSRADVPHPLRIGADQQGNNAFAGEIAAVRLYDRALTPSELTALAALNPSSPPTVRPVWEWRPAPEFHGHTTRSGTVENTTVGGVPCCHFKGGFLQAVTPLPAFGAEFTVDAWIRPSWENHTGRLVDRITPGGTDGFTFDLLADKLRFILGELTVTRNWESDPGGWAHVAAVGKGGKVSLWINGRDQGPDLLLSGDALPPDAPLSLWWRRPGHAWTEAMVLGNGRLGAMVSGGICTDRIWLNEDTLWSGEPFVPENPEAIKALPDVRRLLIERKEKEAHSLFNQKMLGPYNECYLPLGQLELRFPITGEVQDYRRTLDLRKGIATVQFRHQGVVHNRQTFCTSPDQAIVIRITADQPRQVNFSVGLTSLIRHQLQADGQVLTLTGRCPIHADPHYQGSRIEYDNGPTPKGMNFAVELHAVSEGGQVVVAADRLLATNCNAVTLILVAATSYNGFDKSPSRQGKNPVALCQQQATAARADYAELLRRHIADFTALMDRVSLDLGQTPAALRPTDERLRTSFKLEDLPSLAALYYQFGRYLLVSSSRPGSQPANLQGIWNRSLNPPWSANWTMNCNANFNYLGIESANLSELHEPFIRLIQEWSVDGERTARNWYGCRGWTGHHNCDLWRNACPVGGDASWAAFPCGGAWACQDLFEHYAFTLDREYLRRVWPILRGNAEFFLDFLFQDAKTGYLVTGPDTNFENGFKKPNSPGAALCLGPTPSNMMIRQLFRNCMAAAAILDCDQELRVRLEKAIDKLPPTVVNPRNGEVQEYLDPAYEVADRGVCELLSAWGLIWCDQVVPRRTPELAAAFRKAYEAPDRRPWLTGAVGSWQGAFPANAFARLGDGDRVCEVLARHFQQISNPNFTAGFIQSEWEIDGNLGLMAAIGEMLMQSHAGEIELLPAVPKTWRTGSVKGLKARGDITVDLEWKEGKVSRYQLRSARHNPVRLRVNGELTTAVPRP